ncbi:MAG: hypothetical protein ACLQQ4_13435 [Bacteroidia bacterium]
MNKPDPAEIRKAKLFHDELVKYLEEYEDYLLTVKLDSTLVSHKAINHEFINFIYNHHLISDFDQITVPLVNSKFLAYFKKSNKLEISNQEMKTILRGFFVFLYGKHGIKNERVMKGLTVKAKG